MDSGTYGKIIKGKLDMNALMIDASFLIEYLDIKIDYISELTPTNQSFKDKLKLFYRGIDRYAKDNNIKPHDFLGDKAYRISFNDLLLAVGKNENDEYFIYHILDYDYDKSIDFNAIIKYYGGQSKPVSKYLHLNKRAVN